MASSTKLSMLPLDLIRQILLRTPAESLIRAKLTCKQWRDIIDDKDNGNGKKFIYEHLDRSPERFLRIDQTIQVMDLVNRTRSDSPIPDDVDFQPNIQSLVHCDGLMLCAWFNSSFVSKLALWNPLTRNINWVEPSPSQPEFGFYDSFGIGYDNNKPVCDYKILKFPSLRYYCAEIYECNSKSWKNLDVAKVDRHVYCHCNGVSVKGNMYWLARKQKRNYILGFDFSAETFKDICFCPYDTHYFDLDTYLGGFNKDSLSLLYQNQEKTSLIEVWVSSKLADGNVSFTQHFTVDRPDLSTLHFTGLGPYPVYCIVKNKRIIAWCARAPTGLIIYEIDKNRVIHKRETEGDYKDDYPGIKFCGYVYVPSLVPLP